MTTVGILPLRCFDMVLGQDWLEDCSPMWVHWSNKVIRFTHLGKRIELFGVHSKADQCSEITAQCLSKLLAQEAIQFGLHIKMESPEPQANDAVQELRSITMSNPVELPVEVKALLNSFKDLFQEPTTLPPQRSFDHHIQLLPGAPPMNIRPYKYSPAQKDEIEKQVTEMLRNGIIKPS